MPVGSTDVWSGRGKAYFTVDARVAINKIEKLRRASARRGMSRKIARPAAKAVKRQMELSGPTPKWLTTTAEAAEYERMGHKKIRKYRGGPATIKSGNLRKSYVILRGLKRSHFLWVAAQELPTITGAMVIGATKSTASGYYASWVAKGTRERYTKKGARRGRIAGDDYRKQNIKLVRPRAESLLKNELYKWLAREAQKADIDIVYR